MAIAANSSSMPLAELRRMMEAAGGAGSDRPVLPFGIQEIDDALPSGGLAVGAIHEVVREAVRVAATPATPRSSRPVFSHDCPARFSGACTAVISSRRRSRVSACILTASFSAKPGKTPKSCRPWKKVCARPALPACSRRTRPRCRRSITPSAARRGNLRRASPSSAPLRRSMDQNNAAIFALAYYARALAVGDEHIDMGRRAGGRIVRCRGASPTLLDCGGMRCAGSLRSSCQRGRPIAFGAGTAAPPGVNRPMVTAMQDGNRRVLAAVDDAACKLKLADRHDGRACTDR